MRRTKLNKPKGGHVFVLTADIAITIGTYLAGEMGLAMFFGFFAVAGAIFMFFEVFFGKGTEHKSKQVSE